MAASATCREFLDAEPDASGATLRPSIVDSGARPRRDPRARRARPTPTSAAAPCSARGPAQSPSVRPSRQHHRPGAAAAVSRRPATTTAAPRRAPRERGRELVGFYHSHPDHPAEPSAFDLEHAWPNLSYVIVSVRTAAPPKRGRGGCAPIAPVSTKNHHYGDNRRCQFGFSFPRPCAPSRASRPCRGSKAHNVGELLANSSTPARRSAPASVHAGRHAAQLRERLRERRRHPAT